jgi:hypothetical protein
MAFEQLEKTLYDMEMQAATLEALKEIAANANTVEVAATSEYDNAGIDDEFDFPSPVLFAALDASDAEHEWLTLNEWVEEIRHIFALPVQVIPPFWHRHPILVEHLSALHTHFLGAYDKHQNASAPFGWLRDLSEWELRAREIVARLGTRLDTDRPQQTPRWPGEPDTNEQPPPVYLADRYIDFVEYVNWDLWRRQTLVN